MLSWHYYTVMKNNPLQRDLFGQKPVLSYALTHHTVVLSPVTPDLIEKTGGRVTAAGLEVPYYRWPEVSRTLGFSLPQVDQFLLSLDSSRKQAPEGLSIPQTKLLNHQKVGVNFMYAALSSVGYVANHDEQGLGKTLQAILTADMGRMAWGTKHVLVLCPAYLVRQWAREILKFSYSPVLAVPGDFTPDRKKKYLGSLGHVTKAGEDLRLVWEEGEPYFVVLGYDSLRSKPILSAVLARSWDIAIMDEITCAYNHNSQRGKAVRYVLGQVSRRIGLTGTPVMNRPMDVWSELDLLSGMAPSENWFVDRYCLTKEVEIKLKNKVRSDGEPVVFKKRVVAGWRKRRVPELAPAIARLSIRRRRSEATDLPPIQYRVLNVEMSGKQKTVYDSLEKERRAIVGKVQVDCSSSDLTALTYLRIAADGLQHWGVSDSAKADAALQMLKDSEGTPTLIFTAFEKLAHDIHQRAVKDGFRCGIATGGESARERDEVMVSFQNREELDVVVTTFQATQFGLNLQRAEHVILCGMMYNPKMMEQSITRAHRLGGSDRTLVSLLITSNTVDEHIFTKIIGGKAELIEALNVAGDIEAMMKEQPQDFIPGRRTK